MTEKNPKSAKFKDLMYAMYLISHSDKKCKAELSTTEMNTISSYIN